MATQSAFAHNRQDSASSATMSFPLPASPTLTNPDMILPDYPDYDPPEQLPEARLTAWRNPSSSGHSFHLPMSNGFSSGINPSTPIIYGNGTMLSDIGEVTEVESNAGVAPRRSSSRYSQFSDEIRDLHTPPAVAKVLAARRGQVAARRASIDSNSTITTKEDAGNFTDFDDLVSVDDVSFQGDDEESMASSYVDDMAHSRRRASPRTPVADSNTDRYSTSLLSKKAEEILANAKRRLTTMEGNLTRARSTLASPITSDGSTPSPPILRPATASRISGHGSMHRHSRNMSDISFQEKRGNSTQVTRSASAMGAAGGYRQPILSPRFNDVAKTGQPTPVYSISHYPLDTALEPLGEDVLDTASNGESRRESMRASFYNSTSPDPELGISRSSSVAQVRDLQDQMNGLRGKISSLREQARADSLKRRSMQSLRTPSPFTHARWDQGYMEPRDIRGVNGEGAAASGPEKDGNIGVVDAGAAAPKDYAQPVQEEQVPVTASNQEKLDDAAQVSGSNQAVVNGLIRDPVSITPADDLDDLQTENGDETGSDIMDQGLQEADITTADDASESGESLYHEAYQAPISHEDREDAFDYEHFFLHSAMGTISQGRLGRRGGPGSVSSEDSIETTRPITPMKRASMETISSIDTFATADEGRASRVSEHKAQLAAHARRGLSQSPTKERQESSDPSDGSGVSSTTWGRRPRAMSALQHSVIPSAKVMHRPSVSSFESTGTTRSFPLVSPKTKTQGGVWTPNGSPDDDLRQVSDALIKETLSVCDVESPTVGEQTPPMQLLSKEDRLHVDRLVASLGRCVLILGEASSASTEARAYRRRLDAARRILEGLEEV